MLFALSLVLALLLITAALGFSAKMLFQPDIYKNAFDKAGAYAFLESQLGSLPVPIKGTVKENVDRILDNGFMYLRGESGEPGIYIELDGSKIKEFFMPKAMEFPVCKTGQAPFDGNDVKCRPDDIEIEKFLSIVLEKSNATQFLSMADGKYDLLQTFDKERNIEKARGYVSTFNQLLNISVIACFSIFVLMFFIARRSLKSSVRWIGFSFVVAGLVVFSIPYAARMAVPLIVEKSQAIEFMKIDPLDLINPLLSSIESNAKLLLFLGAALFSASSIPFLQKFTIGKGKDNKKS